jgi:hypothetical protein
MLKGDLQACHIPPHALYQHNLGALKISLAEATYMIQDSQIGDWELANINLALSNDGEGLHENHSPAWIQVVDAHAWVRAAPLILIAGPPGELQLRRVNTP